MKKMYLLLLLVWVITAQVFPQHTLEKAYLGEDGKVLKESLVVHGIIEERGPSFEQLPGWPKKIVASPNFKPFRGVTLADIDGDGMDEILVAGHNRMHVFTGDGSLMWQKNLTGTAIYPPSVAVMDNNGTLGIVQVTGGVPNNGRVYYLNADGEDMPGWPLSFENHWIICAPVLADVSGNGIREIIVQTRTSNNLHVLKTDGTSLNANWPVNLGGTPAVTPSVADIDNDGVVDIVTAISSGTMFAFDANGQAKAGFPIPPDNVSFSYQSPLLVDFDGNEMLSIVGATHGDAPKYYIREYDGNYRNGWPIAVPGNDWTYAPPTVVDLQGNQEFSIFMSKPIGEAPMPMLFGFDAGGSMLENFPINKPGGLEGFTSVADIDLDGQHDLVFGSNLKIDGLGFIHAWAMDGSGQLPGFPLRPTGFTFMNGPNLGDVNGDGMLNLVALSYELNFDPADSTFINVYDLQIPVDQANVLFGTYKGSNDRSGHITGIVEQAVINIDPADYDFGEVAVGLSSDTATFTITNNGNATANISNVSLGGFNADNFEIFDENTYPLNLEAGSSITVEVSFVPIGVGMKTTKLNVAANVAVAAANISGMGVVGEFPVIIVSPDELWIGEDVLMDFLYIQNQGTANLLFNMTIDYEDIENWLALSDTTGNVAPDEALTVSAYLNESFTFDETIVSYATLFIESNDPITPLVEVPVTLILTVGLNENTQAPFTVYPVPSAARIYIDLRQNMKHISLWNKSGQLLMEQQHIQAEKFSMDVSKYPSGVYSLKMVDSNGKMYHRLVIVRH